MNARIVAILTGVSAVLAKAQTFNDFEGGTVGSQWGFRQPTFSGSTSANLQPQSTPNTNNLMQVLQGFDVDATKVGEVRFNFIDSSPNRWVRLTTSGATGVPNPMVPLDQRVSFDVYSAYPVEIALGIRETGGSGPVGANNAGAGTIEWVGAKRTTASAGTAPGGKTVTAGSWQTLSFDLGVDPVFAFTGNGVLATGWGTLESLAITSLGDTDQHIYLDNFRVSPIPEPSPMTFVLIGGGLYAVFALRRKG